MITLDSRTGVANNDLMLLTRVIILIPAFAALAGFSLKRDAECNKSAHQKIKKGYVLPLLPLFDPFYPYLTRGGLWDS